MNKNFLEQIAKLTSINQDLLSVIDIFICFTTLFISCAGTRKPVLPDEKETEIHMNFDEITAEEDVSADNAEVMPASVTDKSDDTEENDAGIKANLKKDDIIGDKKRTADGSKGMKEYIFKDGDVYTVLTGMDTITDFRFEAGEMPSAQIAIADSSGFAIESAISNEHGKETFHLLLRSLYADAETSAVITTDRRTYYLRLKYSDTPMFGVRFRYTDGLSSGMVKSQKRKTDIESLDFGYSISGDNAVKPAVAFSDGKSTYIQFSPEYFSSDTGPALYIHSHSGLSLINYTIKANMYIADCILTGKEYFVLLADGKKATVKRRKK